jgi:exopolysaccharide biosynthesis polyprenyl glycosylphosphotransferase
VKAGTSIETATVFESVGAEPRRVPGYVLPLVTTAIIFLDAALTAIAFLTAFWFREGVSVLSANAWAWSQAFVPYAGILYFAVPVRVLVLAYQGAYRFQGAFSYSNEAIKVGKAIAVGSLFIVAWAFLFRGGFAFREFSYARSIFFFDFGLALVLITGFHLLVRAAQSRIRRGDINLLPTLIVGTNADAARTVELLGTRRELGYRVVGVVSTGDANDSGLNVVGEIDRLPDIIRELGAEEVIITDTNVESSLLFDVMMQVGRRRRVEFRFAPNLFDLLPQKTSVEQIGVLPMVRLFREPLSDVERFIKRASDLVLAIAALILLSPLMAVIALIIRAGSRGPVVFKQERVGMDGRVFLCYKFRTMFVDADDETHREAYRKNINGNIEPNGDDAEQVFGKVRDDPRITPAGRWLRRTSLDELPQLFNVIKSDMSIVGPRPPIPYEVEEYKIRDRKRLDMKPGITGLWQVSGRSRLSFEEMVRIDLYYIENWSLWLDLRILVLTLPAVFRGDGAR